MRTALVLLVLLGLTIPASGCHLARQRWKTQNAMLQARVDQLSQDLQAERARKEEAIAALNEGGDADARLAARQLQRRVDDLARRAETERTRREQAETELARNRTELEAARKARADAEARAADLELMLAGLRGELRDSLPPDPATARIRSELESLREKSAELERMLAVARDEREAVRRDLASARSAAREAESLRTERDRALKQIDELRGQIAAAPPATDADRLRRENEALAARIAAMSATQAALDRVVALNRDLTEQISALRTTNADLVRLREENATLAAQLADMRTAAEEAARLRNEDSALAARAAATVGAPAQVVPASTGGGSIAVDRNALEATALALRSSLAEAIRRKEVDLRVEASRVVITLRSDQLYRPGTTKLSDAGLALLRTLRPVFNGTAATQIMVTGHTDNTPIGKMPYADNWELASARAGSVVRWLAENTEVGGARLATRSRAWFEPAASNATPEGRRVNRRVEIAFEFVQ